MSPACCAAPALSSIKPPEAMSTSHQLCAFRLADLYFGIDVLSVQEVLKGRELTRIPLAPDSIEGLLNLRGQILTALDLREILALPARDTGVPVMFMIVRDGESRLALLVDSVGDVLDVDEDSYEAPPDTLPAPTRAFIHGVHKLPKQLLHILNTAEVFAQTTTAS